MSDAQVVVRPEYAIVEVDGGEVVVVDRETVQVVSEGIQGPAGASGAGFVHTQGSAATEWIVNHNLGFRPSVEVINTGGIPGIADVVHMTVNQLRVYFATATAGEARCV